MKRLWNLILASRLSALTRLSCLCAGLSLVFMVIIVLVKIPLVLVLGVGVAHAFGIVGVILFGIAVLKESLASRSRSIAPKQPGAPSPPAQSET